jgi:hypothetical protein
MAVGHLSRQAGGLDETHTSNVSTANFATYSECMDMNQAANNEAGTKAYADPTIVTLGTVAELTETLVDKCGGSGDAAFPDILENRFAPHRTC